MSGSAVMFKDTTPGTVFAGTPTMTFVYYDQVKEFFGKLVPLGKRCRNNDVRG